MTMSEQLSLCALGISLGTLGLIIVFRVCFPIMDYLEDRNSKQLRLEEKVDVKK